MAIIKAITKPVFRCFKKVERFADKLTGRAGPVFIGLAAILISIATVTFFDVIFSQSFLKPETNPLVSLLGLAFSLYLIVCLVFHYSMACLTPPGSPLDTHPIDSTTHRLPSFAILSCFSGLINRFTGANRARASRQRTIAAMKAAVRSSSARPNSRSSSAQPAARLTISNLEPPDQTSRQSSTSRPSSSHSSVPVTLPRRCAKCFANGITGPNGMEGPVKPERAHHCRICGVCWLKYDHHCPWINQCVGLRNERYFVLFLIYMSVSTTWVAILGWASLLESMDFSLEWAYFTPRVFVILTWVLALAIGMTVGIMAAWQIALIARGETSVESTDNEYYKKLIANQGMNFNNPFDLGVRANFELFFNTGPGRRYWFTVLIPWPIPPSLDGWNWPKRAGWEASAVAFADQLTDEEDQDSEESDDG